jgi:hypothetical protein
MLLRNVGRPPLIHQGTAPLDAHSLAACCNLPNTAAGLAAQAKILRNPRAVREARLELLREAIFEACGFIRLHAEGCQISAEAADDAGLIHSIGRLVIYTKHAARVGNELRDLRDEAASNKEGGQ